MTTGNSSLSPRIRRNRNGMPHLHRSGRLASLLRIGLLAAPLLLPAALLAIHVMSSKANAAPVESDSDGKDRYTLMRDGDDFIRMDRRSGVMSICRKRQGQLVCELAADDRDAIEEEFDSLMNRIERLEASRSPRGERKDEQAWREDPWYGDDEDLEQFDQDLDRILDYSARTLRRFNGVMKGLRRDFQDY